MDGSESERSELTDKFVHKLKSRFNNIENNKSRWTIDHGWST